MTPLPSGADHQCRGVDLPCKSRLPGKRFRSPSRREVRDVGFSLSRSTHRPPSFYGVQRFRVMAVMLAIASTALVATPAAAQPQPTAAPCANFNGPLCSVSLPTGVTMRYLDVGPADGPVTLLLHGFARSEEH